MTETQPPNPYPPRVVPQGGGVGMASLVIGLALVLLGIVQSILSMTAPLIASENGMSASQIGMMFGAMNLVTVVIAIAGVVTGLIGIQPAKTRGRLAAAAGLALSGAHVLSVVVVFTTSAVLSAL
jgi:hypothetical protein